MASLTYNFHDTSSANGLAELGPSAYVICYRGLMTPTETPRSDILLGVDIGHHRLAALLATKPKLLGKVRISPTSKHVGGWQPKKRRNQKCK